VAERRAGSGGRYAVQGFEDVAVGGREGEGQVGFLGERGEGVWEEGEEVGGYLLGLAV
jgi:hypothetical protein